MEIIRAKKPTLSIDLAPLIDVVFQLLVFFMLTSTFVNPSMSMTLPKAVTSDEANPERIIISVNQEGEIFLNTESTSLEKLKTDLNVLFQEQSERSVHIKGDKEMPYKYFVQIMDHAKQAGAQQINIVHQRDSGQ